MHTIRQFGRCVGIRWAIFWLPDLMTITPSSGLATGLVTRRFADDSDFSRKKLNFRTIFLVLPLSLQICWVLLITRRQRLCTRKRSLCLTSFRVCFRPVYYKILIQILLGMGLDEDVYQSMNRDVGSVPTSAIQLADDFAAAKQAVSFTYPLPSDRILIY